MRKDEVAHMLETMGALLEIKGESSFKTRSYKRAAENILEAEEDLRTLAEAGRLTEIPGVGKNLEPKIEEMVLHGKSTFLENLTKEVPTGLLELLNVTGVGKKTAKMLHTELGVKDLHDLEDALLAHRVSKLPGIGRKREELMLKGLGEIMKYSGTLNIGTALPLAESVMRMFADIGVSAHRVGDVGRFTETVSSVDILLSPKEGQDVFALIQESGVIPPVTYDRLADVFDPKERSFTFRTGFGVSLKLFLSSPKDLGTRMISLTGPQEFIEFLGTKRISDRGSEREIFKDLGLGFIPPEARHLPEIWDKASGGEDVRLLEIGDIKGDLHIHTAWSDGHNTVREMVEVV